MAGTPFVRAKAGTPFVCYSLITGCDLNTGVRLAGFGFLWLVHESALQGATGAFKSQRTYCQQLVKGVPRVLYGAAIASRTISSAFSGSTAASMTSFWYTPFRLMSTKWSMTVPSGFLAVISSLSPSISKTQ